MSLGREGPFICDKCGSNCLTRKSFRAHFSNFHRRRSNVKRYCDLCPQSFLRKSLITVHLVKDHLKLGRFECKLCKFKSYYKSTLNRHMVNHGPRTECKICHIEVFHLKKHMKTHIKVKCHHCSKILTEAHLPDHIKFHCKNIKSKK